MSPIDDEKSMVTDWVATKLLKNRVHDVMAQKVVHDVVALISYRLSHPRVLMLSAAEFMHGFDEGCCMLRRNFRMNAVSEVEDMTRAFAKAVEDLGNLLADAFRA